MQLTVQVNNGMIAEHVECGDVIISGEGVRKDEQGDTTVNVDEDLSMAMRVFVEAGLLTEDFQPNGISNPEASYIASCISQRLWQENRWKPFEKLWGINNLSSYYQRALCQLYHTPFDERTLVKVVRDEKLLLLSYPGP